MTNSKKYCTLSALIRIKVRGFRIRNAITAVFIIYSPHLDLIHTTGCKHPKLRLIRMSVANISVVLYCYMQLPSDGRNVKSCLICKYFLPELLMLFELDTDNILKLG
jgi:hypothetical protein